MTRPDLDAIEARALAATPGPWREDRYGGHVYTDRGGVVWDCPYALTGWENAIGQDGGSSLPADLEFIRHARDDVPALVARVRELEAALRAAIDVMEPRQWVSGEEDEFNDDEVIAAVRDARAVLGETP